MKKIFKKIIVAILSWEASLVLKKYKPKIVGITGSVGKTGTKEAVAQVLSQHFTVRKSQKSFNSELGVPLTILDCDNAWYSLSGWIKNILEGLSLIVFRSPYPEWLVLEVGVDRPSDIRNVIKFVKFDVAIVTRLPEIPVHIEFFKSPEGLINEKLLLARSVSPSGTVILNHDDPKIMAIVDELKAKVITYGWDEKATIRGSSEKIMYHDGDEGIGKVPDGLSLRVDYEGNTMPFRIKGLLAHHQLYGVLAAISVGVSQGINLVEIASSLEKLEAYPGRFNLLPGIKQTLIIDDSYNSSPAALESALKVLDQIEVMEKGRKIAVLGDMMELGAKTIEAHRAAGVQVAKVCDNLITVGIRAKFIAESAQEKKMSEKKMAHFDMAEEAATALQELIKPHDIILLKGSQSIRLEKVVEEIMLHPEDKEKLLVRQELQWKKK
jgi:UDP-N-acetylmuramoyl-tripeptide--D-alanyl-D-alanine ligase